MLRQETQKFYRLLQLLGEWHEHGSIIIFVHQQKDVDEMFTELLKYGYPSLALHGGQDLSKRRGLIFSPRPPFLPPPFLS